MKHTLLILLLSIVFYHVDAKNHSANIIATKLIDSGVIVNQDLEISIDDGILMYTDLDVRSNNFDTKLKDGGSKFNPHGYYKYEYYSPWGDEPNYVFSFVYLDKTSTTLIAVEEFKYIDGNNSTTFLHYTQEGYNYLVNGQSRTGTPSVKRKTPSNPNNQVYRGFESDFYILKARFDLGLSTDEQFKKLYNDFDDLEDEIEEVYENEDDDDLKSDLKQLLKKVEACTKFIGEVSPASNNFDLRIEQFDIAIKELNVTYSWYSDTDEFCLKPITIELWDGIYQAIMFVNFSECVYKFETEIVYHYVEGAPNMSSTKMNAGIGSNSVRSGESRFLKEGHPLLIYKHACEKTDSCFGF